MAESAPRGPPKLMRPSDLRRILTNIEGDTPQIVFVVYDPGEDLTTLGPWKVEEVKVNPRQSFIRIVRNPTTLEKTVSFFERVLKIIVRGRQD